MAEPKPSPKKKRPVWTFFKWMVLWLVMPITAFQKWTEIAGEHFDDAEPGSEDPSPVDDPKGGP
ncbi:hypothetical protein EB061_13250 [bacterium]|nr:hypothetical protein [bacterium]